MNMKRKDKSDDIPKLPPRRLRDYPWRNRTDGNFPQRRSKKLRITITGIDFDRGYDGPDGMFVDDFSGPHMVIHTKFSTDEKTYISFSITDDKHYKKLYVHRNGAGIAEFDDQARFFGRIDIKRYLNPMDMPGIAVLHYLLSQDNWEELVQFADEPDFMDRFEVTHFQEHSGGSIRDTIREHRKEILALLRDSHNHHAHEFAVRATIETETLIFDHMPWDHVYGGNSLFRALEKGIERVKRLQ
jgi:hypothetical protein